MYRKIILAVCLCNFAIAAVIPAEKDATILNYDYQNNGRGNYYFSYATSNGIKRNETGQLVNEGQKNEHIAVKGFYAFTDLDGKSREFTYTADENGYHVDVAIHLLQPSGVQSVLPADEEGIKLPVLAAPAVSSQLLASLLGGG